MPGFRTRGRAIRVGVTGLIGASLLTVGIATGAEATTPSALAEAQQLCEGLGATPISYAAARAAGDVWAVDNGEWESFRCGDGGIVSIRTLDGRSYGYANFVYPRSTKARVERRKPDLESPGSGVSAIGPSPAERDVFRPAKLVPLLRRPALTP